MLSAEAWRPLLSTGFALFVHVLPRKAIFDRLLYFQRLLIHVIFRGLYRSKMDTRGQTGPLFDRWTIPAFPAHYDGLAQKGGARPMSPTIFVSAGEASGEHYGALLIDALKRQLAAVGREAAFSGWVGNAWLGRASSA